MIAMFYIKSSDINYAYKFLHHCNIKKVECNQLKNAIVEYELFKKVTGRSYRTITEASKYYKNNIKGGINK